jgi:hypothetical protein
VPDSVVAAPVVAEEPSPAPVRDSAVVEVYRRDKVTQQKLPRRDSISSLIPSR